MTGILHIFVLGRPRILLDGQPLVDLVSVKAQALLFYLAVTGKTCSRSAQAGLLWGDLPEESARANLRLTLSKLRKEIPHHLVTSWQSISFNAQQPHRLDFHEFLNYSKNPEQLREAMALYRGEFLEDFIVQDAPEFESWMFAERERLRQVALKAGWQLAANAHQRGAYDEGIDAAWKVLSIEPWHEETHQQLMQLLAASGQRSAALAQFDVCRHVLAEELGVEPSQATITLYEEIKKSGTRSKSTVQTPPLPDSLSPKISTPNHLPIPLTPMIGRETEYAQILERITDPNCRLLTILGPGGIGKTRLSIAVAETLSAVFPDGVAFVSLEEIGSDKKGATTASLIVNLANALGCTFSAPQLPREILLDHMADKTILLVLDNMEKLWQNEKFLSDVLRRAPKVKVLAASRQRLGVTGEWLFEIKGLSFATGLTEYASATYPAVQLFVECARRLRTDFDPEKEATSINRICQLVDGFPLGIELSAQWVTALSCAEIAAKLERNIDMLTANAAEPSERHHSLRLVMDDSWASLTKDEQRLFRWLSMFRGGFGLAAAEQVSAESAARLAGLVNKSWLRREVLGLYHIHELLRQYGAEQLAVYPDEEAEVRERHARYYARFLKDHQNALAEIDSEVDNLRIAWEWHLTSQQIDSIAAFAEDLWIYYQRKGWYQEAISMLVQASKLDDVPAILRGRWHLWLGEANYQMGRIAQSEDYLAQALTLLGERSPASPNEWTGVLSYHVFQQALHRIWPSMFLGRKAYDRQRLHDASSALNRMGPIAYQSGDGLRSLTTAIWDLNLAELADLPSDLARSYTGCCITLGSVPIHPLAERYGQLAIKTVRSESDLASRAYALEIVALYQGGLGRWVEAKNMLEESTILYDELALPRGQIESRSLLAKTYYYQGQFKKAHDLHHEALAISEQQGDLTGEHWSLMGLVECMLRLEQSSTDVHMNWLERVNTIQTKIMIGRADMIRYFGVLAQAHLGRGDFAGALEAAQAGLRMIRQKPFAGSWTMEGYSGVAESLLSLLEINNTSANKRELLANAGEANRSLRAFSKIFSIAQPRSWLCQSWYERIVGKQSQSRRSLQTGITLAERLVMPYEQAQIHFATGRYAGSAHESDVHLQKASDLYAELGIPAKFTL